MSNIELLKRQVAEKQNIIDVYLKDIRNMQEEIKKLSVLELSRSMVGDIYKRSSVRTGTQHYIVAAVDKSNFRLINLLNGTRWSDEQTLDLDEFELVSSAQDRIGDTVYYAIEGEGNHGDQYLTL